MGDTILTVIFMGLPIGGVVIGLWSVYRHVRPTPKVIERRAAQQAFKEAVIAHLQSLNLSSIDAEAVNAWAWAAKSGWDAVDPGSFPLLSSRVDTQP